MRNESTFTVEITNQKELDRFKVLMDIMITNPGEISIDYIKGYRDNRKIGEKVYLNDWFYDCGMEYDFIKSATYTTGKGPVVSLIEDWSLILRWVGVDAIDVAIKTMKEEIGL